MTKESKKIKEEKKDNITEEVKSAEQEKIEAPVKEKKEEGKVGLLLKEMRNKQGKTFAEISQELCIRKSYLEAIENSDYNNIPEYPYGIGFIRSYADYLGLDGNNIVKMYKEEAEADFRKKHPYFVMEPQVEATVPSRKYLVISLLAIIGIYIAWSVYNKMTYSAPQTVSEETTTQENIVVSEENMVNYPLKVEDYTTNVSVSAEEENNAVEMQKEEAETDKEVDKVSQEAPVSQITVTNESFDEGSLSSNKQEAIPAETNNINVPATTSTEPEKSKPVKSGLTVNVLKETWIEVKNEKTLYISKVLQAGDSYTLPKAENLKLSVGKAEGVEIMYNGKKAYEVSPNKKMNISVDEIIAGAQD